MDPLAHSANSSSREKILEHLFVGELLRCLWKAGVRDVEILRAEVDAGGYDIAIECGGALRHIQLKASHRTARTTEVPVNIRLSRKPSGCVIWLLFDPDTLALGPFLWFGGLPGTRLPDLGDRIGQHSRANSQGEKGSRPGIRVLRKSCFSVLETMEDITIALFGAVRGDTEMSVVGR
jgi:hypothetical protein